MKVMVFDIGGTLMEYKGMPISYRTYTVTDLNGLWEAIL